MGDAKRVQGFAISRIERSRLECQRGRAVRLAMRDLVLRRKCQKRKMLGATGTGIFGDRKRTRPFTRAQSRIGGTEGLQSVGVCGGGQLRSRSNVSERAKLCRCAMLCLSYAA